MIGVLTYKLILYGPFKTTKDLKSSGTVVYVLNLRCYAHCGVRLTAMSDLAVSSNLRVRIPGTLESALS